MIEITGLDFSYADNKLFSGLNLTMSSGNIYGLLGKNGAGKTTLLKIVSGLIFPQKGMCEVMGFQPQRRFPQFLTEIYFVCEEFYLPPINAEEYVRLYSPFYERFDKNAFNDLLTEFEVEADKQLINLSYGQKKKFLIAFGLATDCRLLILDEPTNGLDIPSKSQFRKLLAASLTEEKTFIISTHQVRDMENFIDPIVILNDGKIIFDHFLDDASKNLFFKYRQKTLDPDVLYHEKGLGGYTTIEKNKTGEDSMIDMEVLFNFVISRKSFFK
jgi:ABC-2 type transport system ATP-binding protein